MKLNTVKSSLKSIKTDLFAIVVEPKEITGKTKSTKQPGTINLKELGNFLDIDFTKLAQAEGFSASSESTLLINFTGNKKIPRVLLLSAAKEELTNFELIEYYRNLGASLSSAAKPKLKKIVLSGNNLQLNDFQNCQAFVEGFELAKYKYDKYKSSKPKSSSTIDTLAVLQSKKIPAKAVSMAKVFSNGTKLARDLVNMPAADCDPSYLVSVCRSLARKKGLKIQVLDRQRLKKMKAFSLLSVAEGSEKPPYLIKLTYKPKNKRAKVISIVGKGITFDTGGNSIKPGAGMMDMKMDMSGAAAVIGAMEVMASLKPKHEIRAYIPTCENMVSGRATRPGDIVKAMNGKSIEVLNTDAEGRLILADALCLAEKDGANVIIDLATLTGACVVALGTDYAGLYSSKQEIAEDLINAGELAGERLWHMPLAPEYKSLLSSYIADMKNIGGSFGGSITAALFLNNFIDKTPWAHIDIAGPAFRSSGDSGYLKKGGVGFGVRTLANYILNYSS
ncbi:MAG: leucyl aminopeptidase [Bdellovibrionales bacterium]|nr:leucyl aminopeptidase [Bdellovibrionales bacterium]